MEAEVLLHEILHAVWYTFNLYDGKHINEDLEENVVRTLSTGLSTVLVQNPSLLAYFKRAWK